MLRLNTIAKKSTTVGIQQAMMLSPEKLMSDTNRTISITNNDNTAGDTSRYSNIPTTTYPETGRSKTTESSGKRVWDLQQKSLMHSQN